MNHKLLGLLALVALLLAIPAAAQFDPDPCFDASLSKSQYAACVADSGGGSNSGGGGATNPPCMSCVIGDWGDGYQSQCVDPSRASSWYAQYSNCRSTVYCWPGYDGVPRCEWGCDGNACLHI